MTIEIINIGSGPNSTDAESTRDGFQKVNSNFAKIEARVNKLEQFTHPYNAYIDDGFPTPDFTYASKNWDKFTSISRLHDVTNLASLAVTNTVKMIALSQNRYLLCARFSTLLIIKIYEIEHDIISLKAEKSITVSGAAAVIGMSAISENNAKISLSNGAATTIVQSFIEISYAENELNISLANATITEFVGLTSFTPSNYTRAALVGSVSAISIYSSHSSTKNLSAFFIQKFQNGQSVNLHQEAIISTSTFCGIAPSFDYLGNSRFIAISPCSTVDSGNPKMGITVFEADDNVIKILGQISMSGAVPDGGMSVFSLSPSLAIASWSSAGMQKSISIFINENGQAFFIGSPSSLGILGSTLICGTHYKTDEFLVGSWPNPATPGSLSLVKIDTETGVISTEKTMSYSLSWSAANGKFMDMFRISDNRVLLVSQPTVATFGVALDVLEFSENEVP